MDEHEKLRLEKLHIFENAYYQNGAKIIAGADEAGRGPLAGPVVAACVILPPGCAIEFLNDSKKLSPKKRLLTANNVREAALDFAFGEVASDEIDEINIQRANYKAIRLAAERLKIIPDIVFIDYYKIPDLKYPQLSITRGDSLSASIAAASVLAKTARDAIMEEYSKIYPQYGFEKNKGYGTKEHIAAIKKYGSCAIHRKSFIEKYGN